MDQLETLHLRILACRACEVAGYIERAAPVVAGHFDNRMMLVGQAPGITEMEVRRPFNGRAGRELFRWMKLIGIEENDFRRHVYMTSVTKCYPGRVPCGSGDRRPSTREIALCRPHLEQQLALVNPDTIVLVGSMAIEKFLPKRPMDALIGRQFERDGKRLVPLPHPSGASRWLNVPLHRELLREALIHVRAEWDRLIAPQMVEPIPLL